MVTITIAIKQMKQVEAILNLVSTATQPQSQHASPQLQAHEDLSQQIQLKPEIDITLNRHIESSRGCHTDCHVTDRQGHVPGNPADQHQLISPNLYHAEINESQGAGVGKLTGSARETTRNLH